MRVYTLEREQVINATLEEVFGFFKKPENLEKITPGDLGFQILTPKPIQMEKGALIDYTITPFVFPMRWTTIITDYNPPDSFADQQLRGPYAYWHHTHTFEVAAQGVRMKDRVLYALGFGFLGDFVHKLFVRRQLESIFNYRAQVIEKFFRAKQV